MALSENLLENEVRSTACTRGIDLSNLPRHIGIIMDGNGRWAQGRGLARLVGHREGYRTLRGALLNASELGVECLTVYAFSAENWRRPREEISGLMQLIELAARDELRVMHRNNVRVRVAGRISEVPEGLRRALEHGVETTRDNTGITFTLAVNYGGRAEIVDAIKRLITSGEDVESLTEESVSKHLYNPDLPDPDLIVRTAGEMRWSNFLIWQAAYAELFVTPKPWPEFGLDDLLEAVSQYQNRTRKFGGL